MVQTKVVKNKFVAWSLGTIASGLTLFACNSTQADEQSQVTLVNREKLSANLEQLSDKMKSDSSFGKVWPQVETNLVSDVLSVSRFIQYEKPYEFRSDEAVLRGGGGAAPSPLRYLLSSIAFCSQGFYAKASTITDVVLEASNVKVLTYMDMRGEHRVDETPTNPQWFIVKATFTSQSGKENILAMVEEANRRCPVTSLIRKAVPIYEQIYLNETLVHDTIPDDVVDNWEWASPK